MIFRTVNYPCSMTFSFRTRVCTPVGGSFSPEVVTMSILISDNAISDDVISHGNIVTKLGLTSYIVLPLGTAIT